MLATSIKSIIRQILGAADLHLTRLHQPRPPVLDDTVSSVTQRIGANSSAEVFSYFLTYHDVLSTDKFLVEFMNFYAENWKASASQWSQDIFIMFASRNKKNGLYLEIGGADGFTHSNTYSLEKHLAWTGTLVEPDPDQFSDLKDVRKHNTLINAAISVDDTQKFVQLRRVGQLSSIAGYEGDDCHLQTRLDSEVFVTVDAISLTTLLKNTQFDYFSLDIEGAELGILENLDWSTINKPFFMTIEHNGRPGELNSLVALLTENGYAECFSDYPWLRRADIWCELLIK